MIASTMSLSLIPVGSLDMSLFTPDLSENGLVGKVAALAAGSLDSYGDIKTMIHKLHIALNVEEHQVTRNSHSCMLLMIRPNKVDARFIIPAHIIFKDRENFIFHSDHVITRAMFTLCVLDSLICKPACDYGEQETCSVVSVFVKRPKPLTIF